VCIPDRPTGTDGGPAEIPGAPRSAAEPQSVTEAAAMALAGLRFLADADMADLPTAVQAGVLRDLERVLSVHTAARAAALAAFTAQEGYADDGQGSARTWLTWQTRISRGAASAAIASMRRLQAHRPVAAALGAGDLSASWGRQICDWTDLLPERTRDDADTILLAAAANGADLRDLAALAEQMHRRLAAPDRDDDGFDERRLRLATTFRGAGRLDGDLTPRCAAAVQAVLDALGKRAGPEDNRTVAQRHHDALEEACRRLIASGCVPDRAGQPTQIQLHMTLRDLLGQQSPQPQQPDPAAGRAAEPRAPEPSAPEYPAAAPGDECDTTFVPIVSGRIDEDLLRELARRIAADRAAREARPPAVGDPDPASRPDRPADSDQPAHPNRPGQPNRPEQLDRPERTGAAPPGEESTLRELVLTHAVALLSGPDRLTAWLRTGRLTGPAGSVSLPLDVGAATEVIPPHLRRAVILRDRHCAAPGCDQPPAACQVHHIVPRSEGGATSLANLLLLCTFHHLILVHRWGWTIRLHADGSTTATSPDGRIIRGHSPPASAA
jgi:hypothetical protein